MWQNFDFILNEVPFKSHAFGEIEFTIAVLRKIRFDCLIDDTFTKKYKRTPEILIQLSG